MNPLRTVWMSRAGVVNLCLRTATLASRAVLVLFLAKYLSPADFGTYSLFAATVYLSLYVVGLDFYGFVTRELLATALEDWPAMLRDQAVLHLCVYAVVLPLLVAVFVLKLLPWIELPWFYAILLGEHAAQEFYRFLLTASRSVEANGLHFLRAGAWIYLFVAIAGSHPAFRTLTTVWICWALGLLAGIAVALARVRTLEWQRVRQVPIDWAWIRKGSVVSLRLLCGTVALWSIPTVDRYVLARYWGAADVGVYSFFTNPAFTIVAFVEACIIAPAHAGLVRRGRRLNTAAIAYFSHFTKVLAGWAIVFCLLAAGGLNISMRLVGRETYSGHWSLYWTLSLYAFVSVMSRPAHYVLYANSQDRELIKSSVAGLGAAVVLNFLLTPRYGPVGAASATAIGMSVVLAWKCIASYKILVDRRRPVNRGEAICPRPSSSLEVTGADVHRDVVACTPSAYRIVGRDL